MTGGRFWGGATIWSKRRTHGAVLAVLLGGGALLSACGSSTSAAGPAGCGGQAAKLTVMGNGTAEGTPDLLTVTVDVNVNAPTVGSALSQDNVLSAAVMSAFTQGGVAAKDLQTTDFSISPNYESSDGGVKPSGYQVHNTVTAMLRDLKDAGTVLDAAVGAGGNAITIESLDFSSSHPRHLQDEARVDAVSQASSHAASMAAAASEHLGPLCSLTDSSSIIGYPVPVFANGASKSSPPSPAVPISAGTQQATAQVTLVYALEPGARSTHAAMHIRRT